MAQPVQLDFNSPFNDLIGEIPDWLSTYDCQKMILDSKPDSGLDALWLENYEKNKKFGFRIYPPQEPTDRPAILIGASPAILRQVDALKTLDRHFITIVCYTALPFCIENGIRVDYAFVADAQPHEVCKFDTSSLTLIATPFAYPEVLEKWKGDIFFYVPSGGVEYQKRIEQDFPSHFIDIGGGNSVNTSMLWAHKYLRVRHFIMVGMSLCYYGDYYYDGRLTRSETDKKASEHVQALDMNGRLVHTTAPLLIYKTWLETYSKPMIDYSGGSLINCTEDGILGVYPEIVEMEGTRGRLKPKFVPWISIVPLTTALEAHRAMRKDN